MKLACTLTFILAILFGFSPAQAGGELGVFPVQLEDLHPTQLNVGMWEVARKTQKIAAMDKEKRHRFLQNNPIPVVVGPAPQRQLYMVDHHHLGRALHEAGHKKLYAMVVEDLSNRSPEQFWKEMDRKGYTYLKDARGFEVSPEHLPKSVKQLGDDPYRSLAGMVRRSGGYLKSGIPFAEFQWADYFRSRIDLDPNSSFKKQRKRIQEALKLVSDRQAIDLPGFRRHCEFVFED